MKALGEGPSGQATRVFRSINVLGGKSSIPEKGGDLSKWA